MKELKDLLKPPFEWHHTGRESHLEISDGVWLKAYDDNELKIDTKLLYFVQDALNEKWEGDFNQKTLANLSISDEDLDAFHKKKESEKQFIQPELKIDDIGLDIPTLEDIKEMADQIEERDRKAAEWN